MAGFFTTTAVLAVLLTGGLIGGPRAEAQDSDRLARIGRELDGILEKLDTQAVEDRVAALREAKAELEALLTRMREIYRGASNRGGERERVEFHLRYLIRWTGYLLTKSGAQAEAPPRVSQAEHTYRRGLERLEAAERYEGEHPEDRVGIAERYLAALGLLRGRKEERAVLAHLNSLWAELDDGTGDEIIDPPPPAGRDPGAAKPPVKPAEVRLPPEKPKTPGANAPVKRKRTASELKELRRQLAGGTPEERIAAARIIATVDQSWVGGHLVRQLAKEEDSAVRTALSAEVLRVGNRHVVRALGKWARMKNPARRREAIGLLGTIASKDVGSALSEFGNDADAATTRKVIETAKGLPRGYGVAALARVGKTHPELRFDVIEALGQTAHESAAKVLISFLHRRKYTEYKDPAIKALRMLGPAAIPALIDALEGRDYRQYAAVALRSVTGERFGMSRSRWVQWWRKNRKRFEGAQSK